MDVDVAAGFHGTAPLAGEDDGEVIVLVAVAVGEAAAVHDEAVVEEIAASVGNGLQVFEEAGEFADEEVVDFLELFDLFGVAAVVALKYPLAGLAICICCLVVYLKPMFPIRTTCRTSTPRDLRRLGQSSFVASREERTVRMRLRAVCSRPLASPYDYRMAAE